MKTKKGSLLVWVLVILAAFLVVGIVSSIALGGDPTAVPDAIQTFVLLAFFGCLILMLRARGKVPKGQVSEEPLARGEKALIWVISVLNPVIAGAIFYYGWKKRLPVKARQANRISWLGFLIAVIIGILATVLSSLSGNGS